MHMFKSFYILRTKPDKKETIKLSIFSSDFISTIQHCYGHFRYFYLSKAIFFYENPGKNMQVFLQTRMGRGANCYSMMFTILMQS